MTDTQTIRAAETLARYFQPQLQQEADRRLAFSSVTKFAAKRYYIPETGQPLQLMPHQSAILEYALDSNKPFTDGGTIVFSTIKKSGKTALSALVGRYVAEAWGTSNEIYMVANDLEQARGRAYKKLVDSIELDPTYTKKPQQPAANALRTAQNNANGWKVIEKEATYEPNRSTVRAISSDYAGEAGSNPTATFWTELWAYRSEASHRLWEELTPVPTRERSVRYVETYAGYEGESDLLWELYQRGMQGRRLTHDDIAWPFPDQPPIWVNENASLIMYWDTGELARRMPWQTPDYYRTQAASLRPAAYDRLHRNLWTNSTNAFIPLEWWRANHATPPLPPLTPNEPVVIGVDAAITNDCFALSIVSRNPFKPDEAANRGYVLYYPLDGRPLDYSVPEAQLREWCARYNVVQLAYDQYQLHDMMTRLSQEGIAWCKAFSQASQREVADKALYDMIRDRRFAHNAGPDADEHVQGAAAKEGTDTTKMRIVKRSTNTHVDFLVATSMASYECLRLNL